MHGRPARQLFVAVILEGASSVNLKRDYLDIDERGAPLWTDFEQLVYRPGEEASSVGLHRCKQLALADISDRFKAVGKQNNLLDVRSRSECARPACR